MYHRKSLSNLAVRIMKKSLLGSVLLMLLSSAHAACQVSGGEGCSFDSNVWVFETENRLPQTIQSIKPHEDPYTKLSFTVRTPNKCHKLDNGLVKIDGIKGGTTCKLGVKLKRGKAEGEVNIQLKSGSAFNAPYKLPQPPHLKIIPNGETFKPGQHAHFQIKNHGGDMAHPVVIHRPDSLPKSAVQISDNTCHDNKLGEGDRCHVGIGAVSGVKDKYRGHFSVCAGMPCSDGNQLAEIKVGVKPRSLKLEGPAGKPYLGNNFKVKVTNQSSSPIKPGIDDIPNGIERVNNRNNTCYGQTVKGGDSCHFVLRADSAHLRTNSVEIKVKDRNDNVVSAKTGPIEFTPPAFRVQTHNRVYKPGETMKVRVIPTAASIHKLHVQKKTNLVEQSNNCGDVIASGCTYQFKVADHPDGDKLYVRFRSHYTKLRNDDHVIKANIRGKLAKLKLTAAPFFEKPTKQFFVIKNTSQNAPARLDTIRQRYSDKPIGAGVHCLSSICAAGREHSLATNKDAQPGLPECGAKLDPGKQCKVAVQANQHAWGTVIFQLQGLFSNAPLEIPVNVKHSNLKLNTGYDQTKLVDKQGLTNALSDMISDWKTKLDNHKNYMQHNVTVMNQGPFDVELHQQGRWANESSHVTDKCSGQTLAQGNHCNLMISNRRNHKQPLPGVVNLFDHSSNSEPLVSLPLANNAYQLLDGDTEFKDDFIDSQLITKASHLDNLPGKQFYDNHLMNLPGFVEQYAENADQLKPASFNLISQYPLENQQVKSHCSTQTSLVNGNSEVTVCPFSAELSADTRADIGAWYSSDQKLSVWPHDVNTIHYNHPFAVYRQLVMGGDFTHVKDVPNSTAIVAYGPVRGSTDDDYQWHSLATLSGGDSVNALSMHKDLYAAGQFNHISARGVITHAHNIARYNGAQWQALGQGVRNKHRAKPAQVYALAKDEDQLFVGGQFDTAGQKGVDNLAYWSNGGWHRIVNHVSRPVRALLVIKHASDKLWVGGDFKQGAGFVTLNNSDELHVKTVPGLQAIAGHKHPKVKAFAYNQHDNTVIAGGQLKVCNHGNCSYGLAVYDLQSNANRWQPFQPTNQLAPKLMSDLKTGGIDSLQYIDASKVEGVDTDKLIVGGMFYSGCSIPHCNQANIQHAMQYDLANQKWHSLYASAIQGRIKTQLYNKHHIFLGGNFAKQSSQANNWLSVAEIELQANKLPKLHSIETSQTSNQTKSVIKGGSIKALTFMNNIVAAP